MAITRSPINGKVPLLLLNSVNSSVNYVIDIDGKHKTYHINLLREMNVRPQYLQHNIQNLSCVNTLYCVNVALIDDTCDDIDIVDAGNFLVLNYHVCNRRNLFMI